MIVAVGTLIYLPFIYMFLVIWIALIIFRPFNWREWVACIIGFITIFFFLAVYYYLNDSWASFMISGCRWPPSSQVSININYYNYLVLIPVIIILVLVLFQIAAKFF